MRAHGPAPARREAGAIAVGLVIGLGLAAAISTGSLPGPWADGGASAEAAEERPGEPRRGPEADSRQPVSTQVPEVPTPASAGTTPDEQPVTPGPGAEAPEAMDPTVAPPPAEPSPSPTPGPDPAPTSGPAPSGPPPHPGAGTGQPAAPPTQGDSGPTASPSPRETETRTATGTRDPGDQNEADPDDETGLPLFWWLTG